MAYTTINKPSQYFNTITYTGAGGATQSVTGTGFSPDLIWIKNRTDAYSHVLQDICRGFGATKNLSSNSTNAEGASGATGDNYGHVLTSDSNGFTVTYTINASNDGGTIRKGTYYSGDNYVSWCWDANGTGVSNTAGSITSTVSANTTSGFSIVQGQMNASGSWTVGHGLGVTPSMIICRGQNVTSVWATYHKSLGAGNYLTLNTTNASTSDANVWNNTLPTSSVYSMNATFWSAGAGQNFIAYCFAEVKGFSKFGSWTGDGATSTDGLFVYLGFKPKFFMWKRTDTSGFNWYMFDTARDTYNLSTKYILANSSNAEASGINIDFVSNGVKFRDYGSIINASGGTYIYMAFAENPFVSSTFIPTTAR